MVSNVAHRLKYWLLQVSFALFFFVPPPFIQHIQTVFSNTCSHTHNTQHTRCPPTSLYTAAMTTWKTQHHDIYDNTESHKASSPPAWHSNGSSSPSSSDISSANEDKTVRTTTPRSARIFGHPNPSHHGGDETTACDLTDESIGVDGMDMESNGHFCGRRETWRRFPRDSGGARACLCYERHLRDNAKAAQYSLQDSGMEDVTTTRRRHDRLCLLGRPIRRWLAGPRTVRRASQKNGWRVCCEGVVAALRFTWSALWMSFMLICMGLAVLFTFWALFPVCTRCRHHHHAPLGGSQYATAAVFAGALQEAGSSPLYINQLQVSPERDRASGDYFCFTCVRMTVSVSH